MKKLKMVIKASWYHYVIGLALAAVGVVLVIIGKSNDNTGLYIGGLVAAFFGVIYFFCSFLISRDKARSICSSCQKKMLSEGKSVDYSYQCDSYKDIHDSNGNYKGTKFTYTVTIVCPHCGETNTFAKSVTAKNASKANVLVDKYIKGLLKSK